MLLFQSLKKSHLMKRAAKQLLRLNSYVSFSDTIKRSEQADKAFEALYAHMSTMPLFPDLFASYDVSSQDLRNIATHIMMAGYQFHNGEFLPVSLVSFFPPLSYLLLHKDVILHQSYDEIREVVEVAITVL